MSAHKYLLTIALLFVPKLCAADQWSWLDNREKQAWSTITITGYSRTITFSVPENSGKWGAHSIRVPAVKGDQRSQLVEVNPQDAQKGSHRVIGLDWERYWGGFLHEAIVKYSLRVHVSRFEESQNFMGMDLNERMRWVYDYFAKRHSLLNDGGHQAMYFFPRFRIHPHISSRGTPWTVENLPTVVKEQELFRLPISDNEELSFWFYYRCEFKGGTCGADWLDRRKELSRRILDTVRLDPDPFPNANRE